MWNLHQVLLLGPKFMSHFGGELQLVSHVWDGDQFLVIHFKLVSTGQVSFRLRPI